MTSGGDCPGLNACIRAVVRSAIADGAQVIGIPHGFRGLVAGETQPLDFRSVGGMIHLGGTALRTARYPEFKDPALVRQAAKRLDALHIDGLIVLGGDGSLHGAWELSQSAKTPVVGVPKTIDNDVGGTNYAIGFDTAVNTAVRAIDKIRDTAVSHERVFAVEVMGRERGYLAAAVGLATGAEVVLVPEAPLRVSEIAQALRRGESRGKKSSIIVVAEGYERGAAPLAAELAQQTGYEVRVAVLGYIQRGGPPTAFDRILGSQFGEQAVGALRDGTRAQMIGWCEGQFVRRELTAAWQEPPPFPDEWLRLTHRLAGIWDATSTTLPIARGTGRTSRSDS
jgi:6-phosphofructokinase 1